MPQISEGPLRRWGLGMVAALWIFSGASAVQARLLNIGGVLSVNYNQSTTFSETESGSRDTSVNSFGQQYSLRLFGDFYRLGGYSTDISWLEQVVNYPDADQTNRFGVTDYRFSVNLFPQWLPMDLSRARSARETDLEIGGVSMTTRDHVDSTAAHAAIRATRFLPQMVLNYQQSELTADSGSEFLSRAASAFTDTTLGAARVSAGYQFSETDTNASSPTTSHGVNLDVSSQVTPGLTVVGFGRYSSSRLSEIATAPGVSFFQDRSFGASAVYSPPLYWWDGLVAYNYNENPVFNDFKSQSVQSSARLRYNEKTDSAFGARYLQFSITDSTIQSESVDASLNYRPFFGLTTGLGGNAGLTAAQTAGEEDTDSLFQHYQYNINYNRPWKFLQYRASYQVGYGLSDTQPTGVQSVDLANGVSMGVDNTNTRIVHVGLNTTYSHIQRVSESVGTEQSSYLIALTADSSYFTELILAGDRLDLRASLNSLDSTGIGVVGRTSSGDLTANYSTRIGLSVNTAYRIADYPTELQLDRQTFSVQAQYATHVIRNMNFRLSVRDFFEDNRYRPDANLLEENLSLNYQLGKLAFVLTYQEVGTRTSGDRYGSRSLTARASRTF
ncbi:MAG: hypothetical protein AABY46_08230 [Nitrospirota bacterium]